MNKVKLEIVKINEDVIETSGACSYIGGSGYVYELGKVANHIKVNSGCTHFDAYRDTDNDGKLENIGSSLALNPYKTDPSFEDVNGSGWYYWSVYKFVKCDNDCEHPIQSN